MAKNIINMGTLRANNPGCMEPAVMSALANQPMGVYNNYNTTMCKSYCIRETDIKTYNLPIRYTTNSNACVVPYYYDGADAMTFATGKTLEILISESVPNSASLDYFNLFFLTSANTSTKIDGLTYDGVSGSRTKYITLKLGKSVANELKDLKSKLQITWGTLGTSRMTYYADNIWNSGKQWQSLGEIKSGSYTPTDYATIMDYVSGDTSQTIPSRKPSYGEYAHKIIKMHLYIRQRSDGAPSTGSTGCTGLTPWSYYYEALPCPDDCSCDINCTDYTTTT